MKIKYLIEDFEEDYEEKIVSALIHLYNELGYDGDICIQDSINLDIIDSIKDVIDREQKSLDRYNAQRINIDEDYDVSFYKIFKSPSRPNENGELIAQASSVDEANMKGMRLVGEGNYFIKGVCSDGVERYLK